MWRYKIYDKLQSVQTENYYRRLNIRYNIMKLYTYETPTV